MIGAVRSKSKFVSFFRQILAAIIGLLAGVAINGFPPTAAGWIAVALLTVYAFTFVLILSQSTKIRVIMLLLGLIIVALSSRAAIENYRGSNLSIKYRICGGADQYYGFTSAIFEGVELFNYNDRPLYVSIRNLTFTADGRSSVGDIIATPTLLSTFSGENPARLSASINYDTPFDNPKKVMKGKVRYNIRFGQKSDNLDHSLIIDGSYTLAFADRVGVNGTEFRFSPTEESGSSFIGVCDEDGFRRLLDAD